MNVVNALGHIDSCVSSLRQIEHYQHSIGYLFEFMLPQNLKCNPSYHYIYFMAQGKGVGFGEECSRSSLSSSFT